MQLASPHAHGARRLIGPPLPLPSPSLRPQAHGARRGRRRLQGLRPHVRRGGQPPHTHTRTLGRGGQLPHTRLRARGHPLAPLPAAAPLRRPAPPPSREASRAAPCSRPAGRAGPSLRVRAVVVPRDGGGDDASAAGGRTWRWSTSRRPAAPSAAPPTPTTSRGPTRPPLTDAPAGRPRWLASLPRPVGRAPGFRQGGGRLWGEAACGGIRAQRSARDGLVRGGLWVQVLIQLNVQGREGRGWCGRLEAEWYAEAASGPPVAASRRG